MIKTVTLILLTFSLAMGKDPYSINLKSGSFTPDKNFEKLYQNTVSMEDEYLVVQFTSIPSSQERRQMESIGLVFEDYLPNNAYLVFIPKGLSFTALNNYGIRSIIPYESRFKINKEFREDVPPHARKVSGMIRLSILTHNKVDIQGFTQALTQFEGQVVRAPKTGSLYFIDIPENRINDLINLKQVKWVEFIEPDPIPDDLEGRSLHRANAIDRPSANGYHYDGTGVSVALADDGPVGPHIDLQGRVVHANAMGSDGTHGDMTVGILMGAGNLNPRNAGMATNVEMLYYDIFPPTGPQYDHINSAVINYNLFGTVITSTSYSETSGGVYTSTAQSVDQQIHQNPSIIHVFSAGNAGSGYTTITGGRKAAKNTIATANLEYQDIRTSSSSRGPAADGRIKPDIAANGTNQMSLDANNGYSPGGGTSAACPGIAGVLAQLYQAYRDLNANADPKSSLMKAVLLNSAEDLGNPGPDFSFGWGRVNALRSLRTLEQNRYVNDSVSQGDSVFHTINVPLGVSELKVMVYWLDKEGSPAASQALVNNLDMTLTDPSNNSWQPWVLNPASPTANAVRGVDNLNNMEQVTLSSPAAGSYSVKVKGTNVPFGPQNYHVVYEFREAVPEVTYPLGGESFVPGEDETIRWEAFGNSGSFSLEYSIDSGSTWTMIDPNIPGDQKYYDWTVPSQITGKALIRVSKGFLNDVSDATFSIIDVPENIQMRWACSDSLQLKWDSVDNANSYEISQLGVKHMDSIGTTNQTYFTVKNISSSNEYWFSVKALNQNQNIVGRRAIAMRKAPGISNCPIANDVAIARVIEPKSATLPACQSIDSAEIIFEIENIGTTREQNFPVKVLLNNGSVYTYQFTDTLHVYEIRRIKLPITANISGNNSHSFKFWTDLPSDSRRTNDTSSVDINVYLSGPVNNLPTAQNFNQFSNCATTSNCEATVCNLSGNWRNVTNGIQDDIDWRINSGGTPSVGTGPSSGFGGSGKYLYLEASGAPVCSNKTAILMSPCYDLTTAQLPELSFYYHMLGVSIGELHVDVLAEGIWHEDVTAPLIGAQGSLWQQRIIDLSPFVGQVINVRFRGMTGPNWESDIAIDEISLVDNFIPVSAGFTFSQPNCAGQNITFTDNSTGFGLTYNWSFGANAVPSTASGPGPHSVTYSVAGIDTATLIVFNSGGNDTFSQALLLDTLPGVDFSFNINGTAVSFINQSSNAASFSWDFGDGTTDNSLQPTHNYAGSGVYTVTLTVNNGCGSSSISKDITIGSVGILDEGNLSFKIYPNPTNGIFKISGDNISDRNLIIQIIDPRGSIIQEHEVRTFDNSLNHQFSLDGMSSGIYTVKIVGNEIISLKKLSYIID